MTPGDNDTAMLLAAIEVFLGGLGFGFGLGIVIEIGRWIRERGKA